MFNVKDLDDFARYDLKEAKDDGKEIVELDWMDQVPRKE
jgi:hypothetical protein